MIDNKIMLANFATNKRLQHFLKLKKKTLQLIKLYLIKNKMYLSGNFFDLILAFQFPHLHPHSIFI
jgi:hypothetical protein